MFDSKEKIISTLAEHKDELQKEFHVGKIGIFGSYSRDEQSIDSDIDILVELEKPLGLRFVSLAYYLEELLGKKVDLVTRNAVKPRWWKYIEGDILYV